MERKRRVSISRNITREASFHGTSSRNEKVAPENGELTSVNEEEITLVELENQIRKLKKKKAAGEDKVKNEAWFYCTENAKHRLLEIIQRIWREEDFSKS